MSVEIKELSPKQVWGYFYELTQIPRPTGHVEAVSRHIVRSEDGYFAGSFGYGSAEKLIGQPQFPDRSD